MNPDKKEGILSISEDDSLLFTILFFILFTIFVLMGLSSSKTNLMQYLKELGQYGASSAFLSFYFIVFKGFIMSIKELIQKPFRDKLIEKGRVEGRVELLRELKDDGVPIPPKYDNQPTKKDESGGQA